MTPFPMEKRSWGPLIAMIDLLFLVVAFFALLLFFVQRERNQSLVTLEQVQSTLQGQPPQAEPGAPQAVPPTFDELLPRLRHLVDLQGKDVAARAAQAQREALRQSRPVVKLEYQLSAGNRVQYQGREYTLAQFKSQVVDPLRSHSWIAFRAYAPPQIPFGQVVASRRLLLDNSGDFDTYWDNLTDRAQPAGSRQQR